MSSEDKRRLTKVERAQYVDDCGKAFESHTATVIDYRLSNALHDLDSADEENTRHRFVIEELAEANSVLARENERLRAALNRITYEVIGADADAMGVVRLVNDIAEVALDGDND